MEDIFRQGFSTKNSPDGGRGYGLALARVVCQRRGGRLTVHNDGGAVFTAQLSGAGPLRAGHGSTQQVNAEQINEGKQP
jgi:two-component system CitB family sensor kinase